MTCKECNQRNPIGNKFCRECGAKIAPPEGSLAAEEAARAEAERRAERGAILLSDAHLLAGQGKYASAIPVTEEAVRVVPFSASAHTLLVTLYEHTGQPEKAIAAQLQVVELLPNAPKEAERLEKLRRGERTSVAPGRVVDVANVPTLRGVGAPETVPLRLPSWFPVAAGAVGGGFALFLGFLALSPRSINRASHSESSPVTVASPVPETAPLTLNPAATLPPAPDPTRSDPFAPVDATRRRLQAEAAARNGVTATPITAGALSLPAPKSLPGARTVPGTAPVIVSTGILKGNRPSDTEAPLPPIVAAPPDAGYADVSGFGSGERLAATPPNESRKRDSYMRIEVSKPRSSGDTPIVAAPPTQDAPDMESDPLAKARSLQGMGRYTAAAAVYREAIAAGAPVGETQQAIGLCLQRADDYAGARTAYTQAITAFKAQIAAGRNPGAAQRGVNSCEAALGVLNGG